MVTRFAPSPTGWLHRGHAYAAWVAWRRAREAGGCFLLRIEDIDPERCRPEFAAAIPEDLRWLGLDWDGEVRVQSSHFAAYRATLDRLAARFLVYPCFCSRAEVMREVAASAAAPHDPDGAPLYPGTCRHLSPAERARRIAAGYPHAWRLDMTRALATAPPLSFRANGESVAATPAMFGDVVLARRGVPASYHLCAVHDDALQGVTLVTRAEDLRPATHLHRLLQYLMDWPAPDYAFFPLVTGPDGRRLSKRDGALSLRSLRANGISPAEIL
jgi:glutamyl-Q tRNA(Asp) synthetase